MFGKLCIVVRQRGWVDIGYLYECEDNHLFYVLKSGGNLRKWGTTAGLEQLAATGPTKETIIDVSTTDKPIPIFAIITMLICDETKWKGKFNVSN